MATRDQLVTWVKQLLNKSSTSASDDTGDPKNAVIIAMLEYERRRLYARFSAMFPARFTTSTTMTYTANATSVALPSAAQKRQLVSVFAYYSTIEDAWALSVRNIQELPNLPTAGPVSVYAVEGNNLYLRPIPGSDQPLSVVYVPVLTDMASGSAEPSEWPADQQMILGTLAAYSIARRNGDPEARGLKEMADEAVELLQDTLRAMVDDDAWVRRAPPTPFEL